MTVCSAPSGVALAAPADDSAPPRSYQLDVRNPMVEEALAAIAGRGGWTRVMARGADGILVTDRVPVRPLDRPPGNGVVLVCTPTPRQARRSVDAISEMLAVALVCADRPADLASALEGIVGDRVSIPLRVIELASVMPELSDRQDQMLGAVVAGQSNGDIGRALYLSPGSVKREMGMIYTALGSVGRSALVARALELGFEPVPVRP